MDKEKSFRHGDMLDISHFCFAICDEIKNYQNMLLTKIASKDTREPKAITNPSFNIVKRLNDADINSIRKLLVEFFNFFPKGQLGVRGIVMKSFELLDKEKELSKYPGYPEYFKRIKDIIYNSDYLKELYEHPEKNPLWNNVPYILCRFNNAPEEQKYIAETLDIGKNRKQRILVYNTTPGPFPTFTEANFLAPHTELEFGDEEVAKTNSDEGK